MQISTIPFKLAASMTLMFLPMKLCSSIGLFFLLFFKEKKIKFVPFNVKNWILHMTHLVILLPVAMLLLNMKLKGSVTSIMGMQHVKALLKFNL